MAEFNRAYPAEFVRKEEASILRALHGKIMIHTMMRCILFLRLVVIPLGVLTHTDTKFKSCRFMLKHADCDLANMLDDSSPPIDLDRAAIFRSVCAKFKKQAGPES